MKALDPLQAFRVLNEHDVRFVVVGGVASFLRDEDPAISTLEIYYHASPENRDALTAALRDLTSTTRGVASPGGVLRVNSDAGPLDCFGSPRYEEIERDAVHMAFGDVQALVASADESRTT